MGVTGFDAYSPREIAERVQAVIAGNLVGGSVLVALVYHVIYRRPAVPPQPQPRTGPQPPGP